MRDFSKAKRIVIKIGTNTLTRAGHVDSAYVRTIAKQVKRLLDAKRQVVIITSGAIGMGAEQLDLADKVPAVKMRQACAAIGQPLLMQEYRKAFTKHKVTIAQVLVTAEVLNHRKTYLNLRNSVETLLKLGVVPVLNENDSVSTDEIATRFGDNDTLSALVASKIDADLLVILSDIDGLYDADPRKNELAKKINIVYEITDHLITAAGGKGSKHATGGMKTKLEAAKIASNAGCRIVLADGRKKNVIDEIIKGKEVGTLFMPKRKLSNRIRWILNSSAVGTINIDAGAMRAVKNHKSLLPSGIVSVKGTFEADSVIMLNDQAKAITSFSSSELKKLTGKHSTQIRKILGPQRKDVVATPENIILLDF